MNPAFLLSTLIENTLSDPDKGTLNVLYKIFWTLSNIVQFDVFQASVTDGGTASGFGKNQLLPCTLSTVKFSEAPTAKQVTFVPVKQKLPQQSVVQPQSTVAVAASPPKEGSSYLDEKKSASSPSTNKR